MKPIRIPIDGVLDLHTFQPSEVAPLIADYLAECRRDGIFSVRIIHGKGTGSLKKRVRQVLAALPHIAAFQDAPPQAGGWGATLVEIERIDS